MKKRYYINDVDTAISVLESTNVNLMIDRIVVYVLPTDRDAAVFCELMFTDDNLSANVIWGSHMVEMLMYRASLIPNVTITSSSQIISYHPK